MNTPACPFCESDDVELVSPFGGQIITSQYRCRACQTYFEAVREDFERPGPPVRDG
jgi:transposase-like protein